LLGLWRLGTIRSNIGEIFRVDTLPLGGRSFLGGLVRVVAGAGSWRDPECLLCSTATVRDGALGPTLWEVGLFCGWDDAREAELTAGVGF